MTNELRILREFVVEFNPFYTKEMANNLIYTELINIVKEIAKEIK